MGADRVEAIEHVVPAGTPKTAASSQSLYAQRGVLHRIQIFVPPGPSGLVGFRFDHSSAQVIPKLPATWIVADNEVLSLDIDELSPWPDWRIRAYNSDVFPHTLYVRVYLDDRVPAPALTPVLVNIE